MATKQLPFQHVNQSPRKNERPDVPARREASSSSEDDNGATATTRSSAVKHTIHRVKAPGSVQALVADDEVIYAGTQDGDIVVWSLDTYDLLATVPAHKESVLSLALSPNKTLLFSTGADSVVNVWSTAGPLIRVYSLLSQYEVGDIFCASYSSKLQTLFWGCQNASLQWYRLSLDAAVTSPRLSAAPASRKHRFFDSLGPGGSASAVTDDDSPAMNHSGLVATVPARNYLPYAHKSYVYSSRVIITPTSRSDEDEILITGGGDGVIKLWSLRDLALSGVVQITKLKIPGLNVFSLAYKGAFLYAGLSEGVAHVYNLASRQLVHKLDIGHGDVSEILVNENCIFCGTSDGFVKVTVSSLCQESR
jgi:di- and tripeptidase